MKLKESEKEKIGSNFGVTFKKALLEAKIDEGVNEGVSEGVNVLLEYIRKNPGQRVPSFVEALKVAPKTIERWLKKLKQNGKIRFEGVAKTGGYYVVSEEKLEETLNAIRKARASQAVFSIQTASVQKGKDKLSQKEIEAEIAAVRKKRKN